MNSFNWEAFERELKDFDYTYQMSDSHSVWDTWNRRENLMRFEVERAMKADSDRAKKLIDKYRPKHECVIDFRVD